MRRFLPINIIGIKQTKEEKWPAVKDHYGTYWKREAKKKKKRRRRGEPAPS
jgi:hypothetical protein